MLHYTQMHLNRASSERKSNDWIIAQMRSDSHWLLIDEDKNLVDPHACELLTLSFEQIRALNLDNAIFLGVSDEKSYFALDITHEKNRHAIELPDNGEFVDMRQIGPKLTAKMGSVGVLAKGLCYWHNTHKFCGRCGTENRSVEAGHARKCRNLDCKHMTFPRTDPAVIMLVTHTFNDGIERCLLGRQSQWPDGVYSTLAGFVDPAETLEQAVIREVKEEANIDVNDVKYLASQPWPFPSSLMLGFIAQATTIDIAVEQDELEHAQWFSRTELDAFTEWGDDGPGFKLTRKDSISRYLIDYWRAS
ncbi:NAD(+) diphosphatase [Pseudoalteromonas sp. MMG013]|uniref:NAD(+) diphosphatase n=1 Tax=Pseudoalteromonas sp. MMG013 TaxID=2822687 RepID=UPI0032B4C875